jgi:hypothetical protein
MKKKLRTVVLLLIGVLMLTSARAQSPVVGSATFPSHGHHSPSFQTHLGFDRNDYPGDANLAALRKTFDFMGYWLSNPPGASTNSWHGKRKPIERAGFGFLLLFNGRSYADLKTMANLGASDGELAAQAAKVEGFPRESVIFLDQEEGGRMLDLQKQYIFVWARAVKQAGYRPGIYCSGIEIVQQDGSLISTASDLHGSSELGELVFWVANDVCPPSPGCVFPKEPPPLQLSGAPFAEVWQFAQSPLRAQFAASCAASYNADRNCYAPGMAAGQQLNLDVNVALSPDPSHARE